MKRLLPFDLSVPDGLSSAQSEAVAGDYTSPPEMRAQQCAIPVEPDPRRTALYAIVASDEGDVLLVQEVPIEIMSFRDTDLVHFAMKQLDDADTETAVTISERTCFDLEERDAWPEPGTPLIVIGLSTQDTVEAEIIASMDVEARYRSAIIKYQGSRAWHRPMSVTEQSGGN